MFEFPRELSGNQREDLRQLWADVWRLTEQLRLLEERLNAMLGGNANDTN